MNADHHFAIGKTHKVCEDYARSGTLTDCGTFAVVSDGCSSSPDTDWGARFIVAATLENRHLSASKVNRFYLGSLFSPQEIARLAAHRIQNSFLPKSCIDATCLAVFEETDGVFAVMVGDGVLAAKRRDGVLEVIDVDFEGAPGYPSYLAYPDRLERYYEEGYGTRTVSKISFDGTTWETGTSVKAKFTPVEKWEPLEFPVTEGPYVRFWFPKDQYELVAVMSDGVHSFQDANLKSVPATEVIPHLMGYKSYIGEFVARRCLAFQKQCVKLGWHHNDDLSVAAIHLGE